MLYMRNNVYVHVPGYVCLVLYNNAYYRFVLCGPGGVRSVLLLVAVKQHSFLWLNFFVNFHSHYYSITHASAKLIANM